MTEDVPVGRLLSIIVSVLAATLLLAVGGLVLIGAAGGDASVARTLTHVVETVVGVFIGIAAAKLAEE
ncbi:MAG TPA: hypothetical protein PJ994_06720 [Tepidiformaceae bacterium]|nr:hypothetical protein [Tepidiformaceae bacterium]HMO95843.1 hypothetical protein [Tepidiformaceae bacterium]